MYTPIIKENLGSNRWHVFSKMFNMTIKENLLLASPHAAQTQIREACEAACIADFIESLPLKYDSVIGEKGIMLSGGQRQRLSIARLFLKNPPVWIFDEATSALDDESERRLLESVDRMGKDKTVITIAHKKTSIASADKIIVLDKGRLTGCGTREELLDSNETYRNLFEQSIAYSNGKSDCSRPITRKS